MFASFFSKQPVASKEARSSPSASVSVLLAVSVSVSWRVRVFVWELVLECDLF